MDPITMLIGEIALSTATKLAFEAFKAMLRGGGRRRTRSQDLSRMVEAVRDPMCLMRAVREGNVDLVANLLELGADRNINVGHRLPVRNLSGGRIELAGLTPLMVAVFTDNASMIRLLVEWGAEIEDRCRDREGHPYTAIQLAAFYNRLRAARTLLDEGADITGLRSPKRDMSLIRWCRKVGNNRMASLLSDYE